MYFDEDLILDIRLNTLSEIVDKFVVCEATRDHGGNKKNLNFKISKFQKFKDKINYIVVEDLPINVKSEKLTTYFEEINRHVMNDGSGYFFGCMSNTELTTGE